MKLVLIRHAKVNLRLPKRCTAKEFDDARASYDLAPVFLVEQQLSEATFPRDRYRFYISTLPRTLATCEGLFGQVPYTKTKLLTEVPNRSFLDSAPSLPYPVYPALGRLQWFLNLKRQPEGREKTLRRATLLVRELEKRNEDCILVSHEFYLYSLLFVLRRRGFRVKRQFPFRRIKNLERIVAEKP